MKKFLKIFLIFMISMLCLCCGTPLVDAVLKNDQKGTNSAGGTYSVSSYKVGGIVYNENNTAVAVVAGQEVDGTWFAVGLYRSSYSMLWLDESVSDYTYFDDIGTHIDSSGNCTGDTDGSDNWSVIKSKDSSRANSGKYLAFEWANSYSSSYASTVSGWYLPTLYEYYTMWKNMTTIDNQIAASHGDVLSGYTYWSSSQDSERTYADAGDFYFGSSFDSDMSSWKNATYNYCRAIIKLTSSSSSSSDTSTDVSSTTSLEGLNWIEGEITGEKIGEGWYQSKLYSVPVTLNRSYLIYVDEANSGSGRNNTLDAKISIGQELSYLRISWTMANDIDACYPELITPDFTGNLIIKVKGASRSETGTFSIAVSDDLGNFVNVSFFSVWYYH